MAQQVKVSATKPNVDDLSLTPPGLMWRKERVDKLPEVIVKVSPKVIQNAKSWLCFLSLCGGKECSAVWHVLLFQGTQIQFHIR